jgi:tripartite-type tricarboxylate transporter receptor subunit TctC
MRKLPLLLRVATLLFAISTTAVSGNYPSQPIRIIVPGSAGGVLDINVRKISDKLSQSLGQPVIVDNRPGANGIIAAELAAKAKPDGYTVLIASNSILCTNPALYRTLPYHPIKDFLPVTLAARGSPLLLVNTQFPTKTFSDFVAYAKAHPGQLMYGSPGVGSNQHLAGELLQQLIGIQMIHVPYKNQPDVLTDLIGGRIQVTIEFASVSVPHVKAGKLRALVVAGPNRKPVLPDVPTAAELGLANFEVIGWNGYLVPAGTPSEIVARLHREIVAAVKAPEFTDYVASLGSETVGSTPTEFAALIRTELDHWAKVVKVSGARAE